MNAFSLSNSYLPVAFYLGIVPYEISPFQVVTIGVVIVQILIKQSYCWNKNEQLDSDM